MYQKAFALYGNSPAAVLWPKGRQDLRFDALTRHIDRTTSFTILDYGCGLAHLCDYLCARGFKATYIGVDIVPEFVRLAKLNYPESSFLLGKEDYISSIGVDHIVASGTFNIIEGDWDEHWNTIQILLNSLFNRCAKSLAVNFMTDQVDFVQDGAFHISPAKVMEFVQHSLSRRLIIDQSYMPYEFTLVVLKDIEKFEPDLMSMPVGI